MELLLHPPRKALLVSSVLRWRATWQALVRGNDMWEAGEETRERKLEEVELGEVRVCSY